MSLETRSDGSLALSYTRSNVSAEAILEAVRTAGIGICDVRTEEADLEDVFVALTHS